MFIHYGLYSLRERDAWLQHREPTPASEYEKLAARFTAQQFDAADIVRTARAAGMRYITLTTRHHEGFSLYDTHGLSAFDAPRAAAGRDLVAEFVTACRAGGIVPFFYHTTLDWRWDSANCDTAKFNEYLDYLHASVELLCTRYGPVGGFWFDGNWSRPQADWKEDRLYAMIRRHQPDAILINNTGIFALGATGHPEIDCVTFEQAPAAPMDRAGHAKHLAAETCQTMNNHWGVAVNDLNFRSPAQLIESLALARKVGANLLLNVGPTANGALPAYERATLGVIGQWTSRHAAAIYDGKPVACRCEGRDFVLAANGAHYYFAFDLPALDVGANAGQAQVHTISGLPVRAARWLDNGAPITFTAEADRVTLQLPSYPYGVNWVVRVAQLEV